MDSATVSGCIAPNHYIEIKFKSINDDTYSPPNNCIPSRAKMRMKRKRRKRSETIDRILLSKDITRLRSDAQYLQQRTRVNKQRKRKTINKEREPRNKGRDNKQRERETIHKEKDNKQRVTTNKDGQ